MMKMEIKKNCTCNTDDVPELKHCKCLFCGLVDIISAEWYKTDKGFICRYCYDKKRTCLELNPAAREKMVKKHNRNVKNWLPRRYGYYLFGEIEKND